MKSFSQILNNLKRFQNPLERYVFPVLLFLWPLVNAFQGVDFADVTYSLGNYEYLGNSGSTWYFATFLANKLGSFLIGLPFGHTLLAMNLMCSLVISICALVIYQVFHRMIPGWMLMIGEWIAISLCWCPNVILYNTLTYLFLAIACAFLFLAVTTVPTHRYYLVAAGFFLGLNVLVRLSNLTQCALIFALWFYLFIRKAKAPEVLRATGMCVLGYVLGFLVGVLPAILQYGLSDYLQMIPELFGMTSQASDYTMAGMLLSTASAYLHTIRWFLILIPCIVMGWFLFRLPLWHKYTAVKKVAYVLGMVLLVRFFYSRGMFTVNYQDYWCMFEWGMFFLIVALLLNITCMTGKIAGSQEERFIGAMVVVLILITPLGSNNYTFPVLNNLFLIAPFTLWSFRRLCVLAGPSEEHFPWKSMGIMIFLMVLVQGSLFHISFAFGDGVDGTERTAVVEDNAFLKGMHTTPENAQTISEITAFVQSQNLEGTPLLTYGNIPGFHAILSMPPALSTLWCDLDSYPEPDFTVELVTNDAILPTILLRTDQIDSDTGKNAILRDFMTARHYSMRWSHGPYEFWQSAEEE